MFLRFFIIVFVSLTYTAQALAASAITSDGSVGQQSARGGLPLILRVEADAALICSIALVY